MYKRISWSILLTLLPATLFGLQTGDPANCGAGTGAVGFVSGQVQDQAGNIASYAQIGVILTGNPSLGSLQKRIEPDLVTFVDVGNGQYCIEFTTPGQTYFLFTSSAEHYNVIVGQSGLISDGVLGIPLAEDFADARALSGDQTLSAMDFSLQSNRITIGAAGSPNGLPLYMYLSKNVIDAEFDPFIVLRTIDTLSDYQTVLGQRLRSLDLTRYGYNVVLQNLQGWDTATASGPRNFFQTDAWLDEDMDGVPDGDGYLLIEWLANLEAAFSADPKGVGVIGASNEAIHQYLTAGAGPEGLTCAYLMVAAGDLYRVLHEDGRREHSGGSFQYISHEGVIRENLARANPDNPNDGFGSLLPAGALGNPAHPTWLTIDDRIAEIDIPILHIGGWFDTFSGEAFHHFQTLDAAHGNQLLIMGPWEHGFGAFGLPNGDLYEEEPPYAFFDEFLKGPAGSRDKVRYYVTGCSGSTCPAGYARENTWQAGASWPPLPATQTRFFLHDLSEPEPSLRRAAPPVQPYPPTVGDLRVYDSFCPLPSWGGPTIGGFGWIDEDPEETCFGTPSTNPFLYFSGPYAIDHFTASIPPTDLTKRSDTWTYMTDPLPEGLEVTGEVVVKLSVTSFLNAQFPLDLPEQTDWVVRLGDVYPDTAETGEQWVALRELSVRWNSALAGDYHEVELRFQLSHYFTAGHRIGIHIANSSSDRLEVIDPKGSSGKTVRNAFHVIWIGESVDSGSGATMLEGSFIDLPIAFGDPSGLP